VVRPNACRHWEDQSEPINSDIQALKELVPVKKIQNVLTDGMCLADGNIVQKKQTTLTQSTQIYRGV
jgi:hypothetical protein